jgi:RNA polymerase sigma factor (sigma-70 family)
MKTELEKVFLIAFERNKNRIYRICCSYSVSNENAQDLFQEVLYHIWKSLPNFKSNSSIDTWIYRITINVCLRIKEKQNKKDKLFLSIENIEFENFQEYIDNNIENDQLIHLFACIKLLNKTDKSIILLYLEDLAYKDISEITGLTENHIAVKVKRIKKKLLTCLNSRKNG